MALLELHDLHTYFKTKRGIVKAVNGVSYQVEAGKTLGVVGESGSGKSVSAMSILKLLDGNGYIAGGDIIFKGQNLKDCSMDEMYKIRGNEISVIFQEPMTSLNPLMSCGRQIVETIVAHEKIGRAEAKARAISIIRSVGIQRPEKVYGEVPAQLSGGMRQRIMIAMALVCNPELLICDEPTTALDVTVQAQILGLIRRLQKEKKTSVVFISHDMGVISQMADRVAVMYAGQLVEYAQAEAIFTRPLHPYTQGLQAAIPKMNEKKDSLESIPGNVPMLYELPKGCIFSPRCAYATDRCRSERPQIVEADGHRVRCFLYEQGGDAQRREMKATDTSETKIENKKKIGEEGEG